MRDNQQQRVDSATCDVVSDAIHGNVDAVRKWLHGDGRCNVKRQAVILARAAEVGHTDICQLVIDCATVSTGELTSALHYACFWGHLSVVQLIVSTLGHHCGSQLLDDSLHVAAIECHTEVVNWLLPLTYPTDTDYIRWDLVQASARGDLTRVTLMVSTIGRNVTDVMSHALWTACYKGRVDIVDWLMTHTSADVNYSRVIYIGTSSMTSLITSCYEGHMTVVKRLLTGATSTYDVDIVTDVRCNTALYEVIWSTQETPLHKSCIRYDLATVVEEVYKSDVNMQDSDGMNAMHNACVCGHLDIVKVLLSVFADTNITSDFGIAPVAVGEYYGNPELAHYIKQNHPMSVSGDGDNDSNRTLSTDHNNTDWQVTLEDVTASNV
jgi:ankyrin repeat protein